ncbi:MAG: DUF5615 family PIN-like protein [Chloroflexi bacterium]|nr:DUF5615 family PIN-like protein [Chloroflexota bacterium]
MASTRNGAIFARLLFDVMLPAELADALRANGYDVLETRTLRPEIQQDDVALLTFAHKERRVLVTCNYSDPKSNFVTIHRTWRKKAKSHSGIILVPQFQISSHSKRWQVRDRLLDLLNQYTWDELKDQLVWLPKEKRHGSS